MQLPETYPVSSLCFFPEDYMAPNMHLKSAGPNFQKCRDITAQFSCGTTEREVLSSWVLISDSSLNKLWVWTLEPLGLIQKGSCCYDLIMCGQAEEDLNAAKSAPTLILDEGVLKLELTAEFESFSLS